MAKEFKRYLVTSALPYANGPVHIGHLAGVYIPSDIYTRYLRLKGCDVISVCGSDEHGVPITIKARKEGVTPQQIVDRYHNLIKKSFEGLGMSFDIYSRTSSATHAATASEFFRKLYDEGKFIEKTSMQYYDEEAQTFLADRYIVGTCPKCGKGMMQFYGKVVRCGNPDCGLPVFRQKAGKTLTDADITELLTKGQTGVIKGFNSKEGKPFSAAVAFDGDFNTVFEFPEKKNKSDKTGRKRK